MATDLCYIASIGMMLMLELYCCIDFVKSVNEF